jgi:hypothetical protein
VPQVYETVTDVKSDNLSETISVVTTRDKGTMGNYMPLTDYQCKLSPEMETVYSEVLVYCWRTKVNTID